MSTFMERKRERAEHYLRSVHGWKRCACAACSGSGRCDRDGAPACEACAGSGAAVRPPASPPVPNHFRRGTAETAAEQRRLDLDYFSQSGIQIPKYRHDLAWLRPLVAERRERRRIEAAESWEARRVPAMRP